MKVLNVTHCLSTNSQSSNAAYVQQKEGVHDLNAGWAFMNWQPQCFLL